MDGFSKSNFLNHKLVVKTNIAICCGIGMLAGFMVSRALLSVSVILFGFNALWDVSPRKWLKDKWWLLSVAWVAMYALSFFWSDNKDDWGYRMEIKMTLLLLPLAFSQLPAFSISQLSVFTVVVSIIFLSSIGYSMSFVANDPSRYIDRYYMSNIIPVLPGEDDYIRYSLSLSAFTTWCIFYWPRLGGRGAKWFIAASIICFVAFLHILAVRMGIVSLYISLIVWAIYGGLKKSRAFTVAVVVAILVAGLLAVRFVPTLKQKADYMAYTYEMYSEGNRTGDYSDIGRLISYDVAISLIKEKPMLGTGVGDMYSSMQSVYKQKYPDVATTHVLLPHNQFLIVWLAGGVVAFLAFVIWCFYPLMFIRRSRAGVFFFSTWLMLFVSLLVEPMLEVQLGVFVYLFFLLWQRHALKHDTSGNNFIGKNSNDDEFHTHISA